MAKFIPKIIQPLLNYNPSNRVNESVSIGSKVWRYGKLQYDRNLRGFQKADVDGPHDAYEHSDYTDAYPSPKRHRDIIHPNYEDGMDTQIDTRGYEFEPVGRLSRVGQRTNHTNGIVSKDSKVVVAGDNDYISIVDIDYQPDKHNSKRYYSYIQLPFVPRELDYRMGSNFVGIASFGRNNPFYQFTGSEDTLTFEIDWFSKDNNREDVIFNCRWLEALTKGDSYDEVPHRVKIVWGKDNRLFDDSIWLLVDAPYRLSNFVRAYYDNDKNLISAGMLPQQAYQTVTFKRLTKLNRSSKEIIGNIGKP